MSTTQAELRHMADAARVVQEKTAPGMVQRIRAEIVEDLLHFLAGDMLMTPELHEIIGGER